MSDNRKANIDRIDSFDEKLFRMAGNEKIIVPDSLQERIDDIFVNMPRKRVIFRMSWKKTFVLAAALTCLLSITVTAAVSALQRRMEAMNQKEIEDYFINIYTSKTGADHYSRPYMESEKDRMKELRNLYETEALFPKKQLTMIEDLEEYSGKGVAFYGDTETFFFPEKEMSDEELLQIIDFMCKRDYSLQKMNEEIAAGTTEFPSEKIAEEKEKDMAAEATKEEILQSDAVWDPSQELTIPYTGSLSIKDIHTGQNCIFLTGWNAVHTMEIGSGDSTLFFDDFDEETYISALCQDKNGDVYMMLMEYTESGERSVTIGDKTYRNALWILDAQGKLKKKVDLSAYQDKLGLIKRMVIDDKGYLYVRPIFLSGGNIIQVFDRNGNYVKAITSDTYTAHAAGGLGIGKDGRVYTQIEPVNAGAGRQLGIASVDLEKGTLGDIMMGIVPEETIMIDIIAPGAGTDFVFWGYDGIFTYNMGDESAVNVLPAYEAPCTWESCLNCALPDGRIVFGDCSEYRIDEARQRADRIPEKTCFYYKAALPE